MLTHRNNKEELEGSTVLISETNMDVWEKPKETDGDPLQGITKE